MGASVNKVIIVGHLGRDPETRYMPNGDAVTNIAVATSENWKDKQTGEKKEQTEWHRITFYRQLAEVAGQYLKKGAQIYVEGRLQTRKWTDKDGIERYTTEIIADVMKMLGKRESDNSDQPAQQQQQQRRPAQNQPQQRNGYADATGRQQPQGRPAPDFSDMDDGIPF